MKYTKSEQQYYCFFAEKDGKRYTISTYEHEVANIYVENLENGEKMLYQRVSVTLGPKITQQIFEEALLAICGNHLKRWSELYEELWEDDEYSQPIMEKVFEKHFRL